jgi:hypothetical protein
LRENFAVHLGDQVILAGCILAPDLTEFDALHCHKFFPLILRVLTRPPSRQLQLGYLCGIGLRLAAFGSEC